MGNPINKVVQLLDDLAAKVKAEGQAEDKSYQEYVAWCEDTLTNTGNDIKTLSSQREKLTVSISKSTSDIEVTTSHVEKIAGSISTDEADLTACIALREKEAADFHANEKELLDVIDALTRASAILQREMAKNPAAFAQLEHSGYEGVIKALGVIVEAASFPVNDNQRLVALVQAQQKDEDDDAELGAPSGAVYKSQSGGIVDTIEELKDKAEEQLANLRKGEKTALHNFQMLRQSLEDSIGADTKDMREEKMTKEESTQSKATWTAELTMCIGSLEKANTQLDTARNDCAQVKEDHEASVSARSEELKVIAEAKRILTETTGGAVSQTYSLFQLGRTSRYRSGLRSHSDLAGAEVVAVVKRLAEEQHSTTMAQLASRIGALLRYGAGAGADPFAKVTGLIKDMISKLEAEAGKDATEKAYCDEQMSKTKEKKDELDYTISKLTSKIDTTAARSASLKDDVKALQEDLAKLSKSQAEMDRIRRETHADFVQAKKDLDLGLTGVRKALSVLKEYYGGGASMLQKMAQPAMPETHSKKGGAGGSIIGILEVCESDFAKNLATEETQEEDAQSEYEKQTQMNEIEKTDMEASIKYKTKEFKEADATVAALTSDRDNSDTELSAVMEYYAKIKERCVAKPETYEERARRRKAEIAGLKEALHILENEAALIQRSARTVRKHTM